MYYFALFRYDGEVDDRIERCIAEIDNKRANRLCESLGIKDKIGYSMTPNGYQNYQSYIMN